MAMNDIRRLCEVNLRIHGTISASKLIFDIKDKQGKYLQPTVKVRINLVLLNTALRSFRVYRICCNLIARLQHDRAIFKDWKRKETLTCF